jgi:hypothetical protein
MLSANPEVAKERGICGTKLSGCRIMVHPTEFSRKQLNSVSNPKRISFHPLQPDKCVYKQI